VSAQVEAVQLPAVLNPYQVRVDLSLHATPEEGYAYTTEWSASIQLSLDTEMKNWQTVGLMHGYISRLGLAYNDGYSAFEVLDAPDGDLATLTSLLGRDGCLRQAIVNQFDVGTDIPDVVYIGHATIEPAYRGRQIGLLAMRAVIRALGGAQTLFVCIPSPTEPHERTPQQKAAGQRKLRKYWSQVGFERIGRTELYGRGTQPLPVWPDDWIDEEDGEPAADVDDKTPERLADGESSMERNDPDGMLRGIRNAFDRDLDRYLKELWEAFGSEAITYQQLKNGRVRGTLRPLDGDKPRHVLADTHEQAEAAMAAVVIEIVQARRMGVSVAYWRTWAKRIDRNSPASRSWSEAFAQLDAADRADAGLLEFRRQGSLGEDRA
jgi:hypothetical protein